MVWGAMGLRGKTPLVVIQGNMDAARYRNEILIPHLLPLMNTMPNNARLFQQDNAPPHRARATFAWFQANNIDVLQPWPASSPDLNPMENLWDHLDNVVRNQPVPPRDPAEMASALTAAWNALDNHTLRRLVFSMRRRCRAVIAANGFWTDY